MKDILDKLEARRAQAQKGGDARAILLSLLAAIPAAFVSIVPLE
jgi:hypothetical protein